MSKIPRALRDLVIERAKGHCEYCGTSRRIVIAMVVDHIEPTSAGGKTSEDNLCYACHPCNESKGDFQTEIDPETQQEHPLFNPRTQRWREHFKWSEDFTLIVGITSTGRATIVRLNMNRQAMVDARPDWLKAGWQPPA